MKNIKHWIVKNPDLAFAVLLAICVYSYFALTNNSSPRTEPAMLLWNGLRYWALWGWR